jgi:spectinomycin phosphotransferase
MRHPPDLPDGHIVSALRDGFGVEAATLMPLPVGNDVGSWSYRVETAGGLAWFLKVRAGASPGRGAAVPAYLHGRGVPNVLAPLATTTGASSVTVGRFTLALYPLLEARPGGEAGLSPAQWRELGATVRQVHAVAATPELTRLVGRETFRPSRRELLPELEAALAAAGPGDPVACELAGFWRARRDRIAALVDRADRLGRELAGEPLPLVLCHADLHTWNVLAGAGGRLWIADWDEAVLAPRERDLFFVVGGGIGHGLVRPSDTDAFFGGYGPADADPRLLAYYRCAWAVQDVAAYGEQVLLVPGLAEAVRRAELAGFEDLFAPGNIVDYASRWRANQSNSRSAGSCPHRGSGAVPLVQGWPAWAAGARAVRTWPVLGPVVRRSMLPSKPSRIRQSAASMNSVRPSSPPSVPANDSETIRVESSGVTAIPLGNSRPSATRRTRPSGVTRATNPGASPSPGWKSVPPLT